MAQGSSQTIIDNQWLTTTFLRSDENRKAIEKLPEKRELIFQLSRHKGLSNIEIAKRLDISKKTVENQIHSALKFLREQFGKETLFTLSFIFFPVYLVYSVTRQTSNYKELRRFHYCRSCVSLRPPTYCSEYFEPVSFAAKKHG